MPPELKTLISVKNDIEFGIFFLVLTLVFSSFGFISPVISSFNRSIFFPQEKISTLTFIFTFCYDFFWFFIFYSKNR